MDLNSASVYCIQRLTKAGVNLDLNSASVYCIQRLTNAEVNLDLRSWLINYENASNILTFVSLTCCLGLL